MNFLTVFFIAVGLAMDAFAVSVSTGMTVCDFNWKHNLKMSLMFGIFQFAMPVAGFFGATRFRSYIEGFDHWIAFALLILIGGKMLWEAIFSRGEAEFIKNAPECPVPSGTAAPAGGKKGLMAVDLLTPRRLLILAVATSIDALAVGVSMAFLQADIWWPSVLIGIVAFAFSYAGGFLGRRIGPVLGKAAEIAGGLILVGIGVKILLDHLLFS
ncbi:MAG: manganese efflux pump MntP family protein [Eubacteriales bacterium]